VFYANGERQIVRLGKPEPEQREKERLKWMDE
jgi:hypothetical protein